MLPHFVHAHARVAVGHVADVLGDDVDEERALLVGQLRRLDAGVVEHEIVAERLRLRVVDRLLRFERRLLLLFGRQRLHQRQALVLLVLQHDGAGVPAALGADRLRAHEGRRHDRLIAEHEVVDDQMMSVELPAPGVVVDGSPITVRL